MFDQRTKANAALGAVYLQLDANYFLGEQLLAETQAVVDTLMYNNGQSFQPQETGDSK